MTPDHLPKILELSTGLYAPIGYNGRGITTGTIFGKTMSDLLTGADPGSLPLPVSTSLVPAPRAGLRRRALQAAFTANQAFRAL